MSERLSRICRNVYGYQSFVETDKAGYVIRQRVASNLYDRIRCVHKNVSRSTTHLQPRSSAHSTRPFLSLVEKKWIAFQILNAPPRRAQPQSLTRGHQVREHSCHLLKSDLVSDFASYKPTFLPLDDPSDFSFSFDTSGRRSCYIAPERFYTVGENPDISAKKSRLAMKDSEGKRDGKVTEAMYCSSVGCVIAELFLEGKPLFTLSELFKYREVELIVDTQLGVVEDEGVRVRASVPFTARHK